MIFLSLESIEMRVRMQACTRDRLCLDECVLWYVFLHVNSRHRKLYLCVFFFFCSLVASFHICSGNGIPKYICVSSISHSIVCVCVRVLCGWKRNKSNRRTTNTHVQTVRPPLDCIRKECSFQCCVFVLCCAVLFYALCRRRRRCRLLQWLPLLLLLLTLYYRDVCSIKSMRLIVLSLSHTWTTLCAADVS